MILYWQLKFIFGCHFYVDSPLLLSLKSGRQTLLGNALTNTQALAYFDPSHQGYNISHTMPIDWTQSVHIWFLVR